LPNGFSNDIVVLISNRQSAICPGVFKEQMNEHQKIYTVSEITRVIKELVQSLGAAWVKGEISNFKQATSGHCYFTLKDKSSQIECALFVNVANQMRFMPKNGDKVVVYGDLSVYEKRGNYQIVVKHIETVGAGKLWFEFKMLESKLRGEGLFDEAHKKKLPIFPERIAVVTSPTGAAIRDIIDVISRRYPCVNVLLFPVHVQGDQAPEQIANAIDIANQIGNFDLMIVGRGGGSIEDLWAFNEEIVVRSIFASEIPVISAVGHEIDYTLSDLVADVRAPTPSAAAEIAVPDRTELKQRVEHATKRLTNLVRDKIDLAYKRLKNAQKEMALDRRLDTIRQLQQTIDQLTEQLRKSAIRVIENKNHGFKLCVEKLNHLSPLATLARGYTICYDVEHNLIKSVSQVEVGDGINVKLIDGQIACEVVMKNN